MASAADVESDPIDEAMSQQQQRPPARTSLEHLCLLDVAAPLFVDLAADAGFDAVGLRVIGPGPDDVVAALRNSRRVRAATRQRCVDRAVTVLAVETLRLSGDTVPDEYLPALETGAELGARYLNVTGNDDNHDRLADAFGELIDRAAGFEIRPLLEPMAFKSVRRLADAVAIVGRSTGGGVMIDSLHLRRCGDSIAAVAALPVELVPYVQLADGPLEAPAVAVPAQLADELRDAPPGLVEARIARALPGQGELPIPALLAALPATLPIALEVPALAQRAAMGDPEFLALAKRCIDDVRLEARASGDRRDR